MPSYAKPRGISANPGASYDAIVVNMRDTLKGVLSRPGAAVTTMVNNPNGLTLAAIPAYEDTLIPSGPKQLDMKHSWAGILMNQTMAAIQQAGRGGTTTTTYNNPFLTPTRTIQRDAQRAMSKKLGIKDKNNISPAEKLKRARLRTVVVQGRRQKARYIPYLAYETHYKKKRTFSRGPKYAY